MLSWSDILGFTFAGLLLGFFPSLLLWSVLRAFVSVVRF